MFSVSSMKLLLVRNFYHHLAGGMFGHKFFERLHHTLLVKRMYRIDDRLDCAYKFTALAHERRKMRENYTFDDQVADGFHVFLCKAPTKYTDRDIQLTSKQKHMHEPIFAGHAT